MNRRSTPGLGQWLAVSILVVGVIFLFYKLYEYSLFQAYMPAGLTIAGVDVGGMTDEQVEQILTDRYLNAPVMVEHPNGTFELSPQDAEMRLDFEYMMSQADFQRDQQDVWAGFWGFLWNRPIEVEMVELSATHNRDRLREVLEVIASEYDQPAEPPQPVPQSLTFQFGSAGMETNVDASLQNVENALYRAVGRDTRLVIEPVQPQRPDLLLLARLIVNHVQSFEGVTSVFIKNLDSGEEITYQADVAMSGMDMLKVPIALNVYRLLDASPTISQTILLSDTLLLQESQSANQLLNMIAGENDTYLGAEIVSESLQQLGLSNTFVLAGYDAGLLSGMRVPETPANTREDVVTAPSQTMQTTTADIGSLLTMLYECARRNGGPIPIVFEGDVTAQECEAILQTMSQNDIGSLIEGGIPPAVPAAHRHGWINDTHGDAGIVFSPSGDYVIVMMMYKQDWLEWELSSPMMADISQATYNYFNFSEPFLGEATSN
jgi:hypothetical protein